jgi:hypothetical protein
MSNGGNEHLTHEGAGLMEVGLPIIFYNINYLEKIVGKHEFETQ